MNLTGMQKIIAAIVAIVVAAGAVFFFVEFPLFGRLGELDARQAEVTQTLQQKQALLGQLREAKTRAPETQAQLVRVANQIPDNPELPTLIVDVQNAANDAGVRCVSIAPSRPEYMGASAAGGETPDYTKLDLNLQIEGTWSDVLDFLRRIGKMSRASRVVNLTMAPMTAAASGGGTGTPIPEHPVLQMSMLMRTYVIGNNGVMAAPASPAATAPAPAP